MNTIEIKQLGENTRLVKDKDGLKVITTLSYPPAQEDVFSYLVQGKTFPELDDMFRSQAKEMEAHLERMRLLPENSHIASYESFSVSKIAGGTGWKIEIIKPLRLSLTQFQKVHILSPVEEAELVKCVAQALIESLQAGLDEPCVEADKIFVESPDNYVLECFGTGSVPALTALETLVQDETLKRLIHTSVDVFDLLKKLDQ